LQTKAVQVAASIGLNDFRAWNGWLEAFRKRHYIQFCLLSGENVGMDEIVVNHWKQDLPNIIQGYDTRDIWNVDETGLWKGVPNHNLVLQGEKCKSYKLAKERLTIALLCLATGEKFKPLMIGKSQMPQAFNKQLLRRVIWKANSNAWIIGTIFLEYLQKFNAKMQIEN
jgi:hypothetical protein